MSSPTDIAAMQRAAHAKLKDAWRNAPSELQPAKAATATVLSPEASASLRTDAAIKSAARDVCNGSAKVAADGRAAWLSFRGVSK